MNEDLIYLGGIEPIERDKMKTQETVVIAKCVSCGHKKEIKAGEVPKGEMPMCPNCFMPMVAEKAKTKP